MNNFYLEDIDSIQYLSWPWNCAARAPEVPLDLQKKWDFIGSGDSKHAYENPEKTLVLKVAKGGCAQNCEQDFWVQCLVSALSLRYNTIFLPKTSVAFLQPRLVHVRHVHGDKVYLGILEHKLSFPNNNPKMGCQHPEVFKFVNWGKKCHGVKIIDLQGWDATTNPQFVYMMDARLVSFCQSVAQTHDLLSFIDSLIDVRNSSKSVLDLKHRIEKIVRASPYKVQIESNSFLRPFAVNTAEARAMYLNFYASSPSEGCRCILNDQVSLIDLFERIDAYSAKTLGDTDYYLMSTLGKTASSMLFSIVDPFSFLLKAPRTPPLSSDDETSSREEKIKQLRDKKNERWEKKVQNAPADLGNILTTISAVLNAALARRPPMLEEAGELYSILRGKPGASEASSKSSVV